MKNADNSASNTRIARNTIFLTVRMIFVLVISLYTSRVILQVLGVEDFGIYNVVGGLVSMFGFFNNSMTNSIQRYYNYAMGDSSEYSISDVYKASIVIQVVLAAIIVIFTETLGLWYLYNEMVIPLDRINAAFWIFQFSVLSMILVIMQVPYSSAIMAYERMDYYAYISVLDVVLKLVIVVIIPFINKDKLIVYGFLILGISIVDFFLNYVYAKKKFCEITIKGASFSKRTFGGMLSFSGWNMFGTFALIMKEEGLNMILNVFFGPVVNAARGIAYQVITAIRGFVGNVSTAARPQFTQSYAKGEVNRVIRLMFGTSKLCFLILFLLSLPVMIEADYILHLWLGPIIPDYSVIFVVLVILSALITVFNPPMSFVVHATGNMKMYQLLGAVVDLLILPVAYIFLKFGYSPEIVFVVAIIFAVIQQVVSILVVRRLIVFSLFDYLKQVITPLLIVSAISSILTHLVASFLESGFLRLIIVVLVSFFLTTLSGYILSLNKEEKRLSSEFCAKILRRI